MRSLEAIVWGEPRSSLYAEQDCQDFYFPPRLDGSLLDILTLAWLAACLIDWLAVFLPGKSAMSARTGLTRSCMLPSLLLQPERD